MKVTFIRHCECYLVDKDGIPNYMRIDPSLIYQGQQRAKKLSGVYDYLILSPMVRCLETFIYSKIKADEKIINNYFREIILTPGDFRQNDPPEITAETREVFKKRVKRGIDFLKTLNGNICVITHSEWMKEALSLKDIPDYGESITIDFP